MSWSPPQMAFFKFLPLAYGQSPTASVEIEEKMDLLQDGLRFALRCAGKNVTSSAKWQHFVAVAKTIHG